MHRKQSLGGVPFQECFREYAAGLQGAGLCIAASGNILASGNISLKLFIVLLETVELSIF